MSASWIDIRVGDKPKRLITYLTYDGRKLQNVCHIGGKGICAMKLVPFIQATGVQPPVLYTVRDITDAAGAKFLDPTWRKEQGL